ncbi:MAG: DUF1292 domain-containing protein [Coprobacillus sp.]|nr:DUF1292 domain-containing protein [Coprobacillus sp.]
MENKKMDDNQITIIDDEGNEATFEILFTYDNEEKGVSYVLFFAPDDPDNIFAMRYDDEGHLYDIESDEEFDEVEEVLNTFEENGGDFVEEDDA